MTSLLLRTFACAFVCALFSSVACAAKVTAPAWLTTLAAQPAGLEYGDAKHVVLLDESRLEIDKNGIITRRVRYAIRVLTTDGKNAAVARQSYDTSGRKVSSLSAWLIPKSGEAIAYGKKETVDIAAYANARELYGESRLLIINASTDASVGTVFGFEAVTIENTIYSQETWFFQQTVPVEKSSLTLTLPPGWTATTHTFNHEPITPIVAGSSQTWELNKLPGVLAEPLGPARHARLPWLALDLFPPAGSKTVTRQTYASWTDVSVYFSKHYETAAVCDPAMKTRVSTLVEGAATPWERAVRLCRFAQNVNYISIHLNSARAGGMIPRPAPRVFQCNYGDCKDKATLLNALLRAEGIESFPVIVYSGDATHVRPEWVSPHQFNHCILAIRVDDSVDVPGVVIHPELGRLVMFDPTNDTTPPGWLAEEDLDGYGLILAGSKGGLVRLPTLKATDNRIERVVKARISGTGYVTGTIEENLVGVAAADLRGEQKRSSVSNFRNELIQPWLARTLPTARVLDVQPKDEFADARFSLKVDFESAGYGKVMRNTLLVFKPVMVSRRENVSLKKKKRTQPVIITPCAFTERAEIDLPDGHTVDESFTPVTLKAPFGTYTAKAEIKEQRLFFERTLELHAATLPADDYEVARVFFEKILQAEQSPVVLKRN